MSCDAKETAIRELWKRLSLVSDINRPPMRNPVTPPNDDAYPTINFFDMPAAVTDNKRSGRTRPPVYVWDAQVVVEPFVKGDTEDSATDALNNFVKNVKREIYRGGVTLGGTCAEIFETNYTQYLRPPTSSLVIGISLYFTLRYIEDVNNLY